MHAHRLAGGIGQAITIGPDLMPRRVGARRTLRPDRKHRRPMQLMGGHVARVFGHAKYRFHCNAARLSAAAARRASAASRRRSSASYSMQRKDRGSAERLMARGQFAARRRSDKQVPLLGAGLQRKEESNGLSLSSVLHAGVHAEESWCCASMFIMDWLRTLHLPLSSLAAVGGNGARVGRCRFGCSFDSRGKIQRSDQDASGI